MACKIPNLVAAILLVISLLFVLLSFEPRVAGGFMQLSYSDQDLITGSCAVAGVANVAASQTKCEALEPTAGTWTASTQKCNNDDTTDTTTYPDGTGIKSVFLVHPVFITRVANAAGQPMADGVCGTLPYTNTTKDDCEAASATWYDCETYDWSDSGLSGLFEDTLDGYSCSLNLLKLTSESVTNQRSYSAIAFGLGTIRQLFGNPGTPDGNNTLDAVFKLLQASGCFLAFGIICHVMAIAMGGFIWNYSKKCCDFGICGFIFNSTIWAGVGVFCYIISLCAFAGIFMQGQVIDEYHTAELPGGCMKSDGVPSDTSTTSEVSTEPYGQLKFSPGGALVLTGILFKIIAISLASFQWYMDQKKQDDEHVGEVARVSVPVVGEPNRPSDYPPNV